MKIGVMGLGKLGLPVALAINSKGHEVKAYDISSAPKKYLEDRQIPFKEAGIKPLLDSHTISWSTLGDMVAWADIIFMPIQTPHEKQFEGATRIPDERKDFDYSWLVQGVKQVAELASAQQRHITLVVISTCLPGTYRREIAPLLNNYVDYVYNPFFIAMGTVIQDFLDPEFVLLGRNSDDDNPDIVPFYRSIHDKPLFWTDITTAEGIKVFYNTFITMKTVLANTYGEMAHKLGMNVDDIYEALSLATDRIMSPKYLKAGMGDGGGCHPRDNIALSHKAKEIGLSHNIFEDLMKAREDHAEWLASLIPSGAVIFGKAFKPETNITTGSPALLVASILKEQGKKFTIAEDPTPGKFNFIATQHQLYQGIRWPQGSTVLDPFGYIADQPGVTVIRIGRM